MNGKIYLATCKPTGKNYVGQTRSSLPKRIELHLWRASQNTQNLFHQAIREYGADAFKWEILHCDVRTQEQLDELEQACIVEFNSMRPHGLNTGQRKGDEHYSRQRGFSSEHRANIAKAKRGKRRSAKARKAISEGMRRMHAERKEQNATTT